MPEYQWIIIRDLSKQLNIPFEDAKFPVSQVMKRLLKVGTIGKIRLEEYDKQKSFMFYYPRGKNVSDRSAAGAGNVAYPKVGG